MNPTTLIFSSIFTLSVFSSSLLFLITKERFQLAVFLLAVTSAFFLNQLYMATQLEALQTPVFAYILLALTIFAASFRLITNRYQLFPKCLLIISIFGSLFGAFFL